LSKSNFARPYIERFTSLSRLTWPSTCPLLHGRDIPAITAARSRWIPLAKVCSSVRQLFFADSSQDAGALLAQVYDFLIASMTAFTTVVLALFSARIQLWRDRFSRCGLLGGFSRVAGSRRHSGISAGTWVAGSRSGNSHLRQMYVLAI